MFTMENCFYLLISQAVRYLRDPAVHPRDKQRMKQELSSELVSSSYHPFSLFGVNVSCGSGSFVFGCPIEPIPQDESTALGILGCTSWCLLCATGTSFGEGEGCVSEEANLIRACNFRVRCSPACLVTSAAVVPLHLPAGFFLLPKESLLPSWVLRGRSLCFSSCRPLSGTCRDRFYPAPASLFRTRSSTIHVHRRRHHLWHKEWEREGGLVWAVV